MHSCKTKQQEKKDKKKSLIFSFLTWLRIDKALHIA